MSFIINPYSFNTNLLLDFYPGAKAAYSVRKLRSNYTGSALRVRRSNDNTEQDIGFTPAGDLDESALTTFTGANSAFVTKWYDQTGNGYDAAQTITANQPRIVNAGTVDKLNGKPAFGNVSTGNLNITSSNMLRNTGHAEAYAVASAPDTTTRVIFFVTNNASDGIARFYMEKNVTTSARYGLRVRRLDSGTTTGISSNTADSANQTLLCAVMAYSTGEGILRQNGTQVASNSTLTTAGNTPDTNSVAIWFGGRTAGNNPTLQEVVVYTSSQSSNRTAIEDNINDYFSVY